MRILADDRIEQVHEAFGELGDLELRAGHRIDHKLVAELNPEILVIRSTCRVDEQLLAAAKSLRIVATATIGTDHVDLEALDSRKIAFISAAGSSAASVAQFTWAMIHLAMKRLDKAWMNLTQPLTIAVMGVGEIGQRVADSAAVFGLKPLLYDPPKAQWDTSQEYCERSALGDADIVSMHLPYLAAGDHPTANILDEEFLSVFKNSALLLNTGRGKTLAGPAVLKALAKGQLAGLALDVFPSEPAFDGDLVKAALLNCPHLAGRSVEGMLANTQFVRDALREQLKLPALPALRLAPIDSKVAESHPSAPPLDEFGRFVDCIWGAQFEHNDAEMRSLAEAEPDARAQLFRHLRQVSPRRDLTSWRREQNLGPNLRSQLTQWFGVLNKSHGAI